MDSRGLELTGLGLEVYFIVHSEIRKHSLKDVGTSDVKYIKANVVKLTWNVLLKTKINNFNLIMYNNNHIVLETISVSFKYIWQKN